MQLADDLERDAKAGIFHDDQYVFSAMNGMGHFEKIAKYFSPDKMVCGTAMIATRMDAPANVDFMGATASEVISPSMAIVMLSICCYFTPSFC